MTVIKVAFHDTDTDSPDITRLYPYVQHAQFPREDPCEDVGVDVMACGLYRATV